MFPSLSKPRSSEPVGAPGFVSGSGYSTILPVLGSSLPTYWDPKSEYQTKPWESTTASCGSASGRGRSYSVMITRVAVPDGRGSVFSGYSHLDVELRLTELTKSPCF